MSTTIAIQYPHEQRRSHRRVHFAVAVSVLLHAWLLWRADAGRSGTAPMMQPAALAVSIKTLAVAPAVPPAPAQPAVQPLREPQPRTLPQRKPMSQPVSKTKLHPRTQDQPVVPAPPEPVDAAPAQAAPASAAAVAPAAAPQASATRTPSAATDSELPLITDPRYRFPPQPPEYPPQAVRRNEEGTTLVRARLSPVGAVIEARVHASSGSTLLDKAALAAVRRWQFVPALHDGHAVTAWVQVPVQFRLDE